MPSEDEDILDALLSQHEQIKADFINVEAATGARKRRLFQELVALIAVHEGLEEVLVHPLAQRELPDGDVVVKARLEEEQQVLAAVANLNDLGTEAATFNNGLLALRDAILAHALAEEELEFAALRHSVDPQQLRHLRSVITEAAALTPTRSHPELPPGGCWLAGAPLALFDQAADDLRAATRETAV